MSLLCLIRIRTIRLQCVRGRLTEADEKTFADGMMQQSFTILQEEHRKKTHNLSYGVPEMIAPEPSKPLRKKRKQGQKNRSTNVRAPNDEQLCPFKFIVFLSSKD